MYNMNHEKPPITQPIDQEDLKALWALRGARTLLGATLPSGTTVNEDLEARRVSINQWAEENGHNSAVQPEDIVPPDSSIEHQERQDNVDSYSHADSDPLSHTNDRWTGNPEMDRAMLVARALAVNLFPKS